VPDDPAYGVDWDRERQLVRVRHPSGTVTIAASEAPALIAAIANAAAASTGADKVTVFTPDRWEVIDDPERRGNFVVVLRVQNGLHMGFRIPRDRGDVFIDSIRQVLDTEPRPASGSH
jgi:hypothetical protein